MDIYLPCSIYTKHVLVDTLTLKILFKHVLDGYISAIKDWFYILE